MVKHFCDICKKEITHINTYYCLSPDPMELCDNCLEGCEGIEKTFYKKQQDLKNEFEKEMKMFMEGMIKNGRK